jgi:hypothetical protein
MHRYTYQSLNKGRGRFLNLSDAIALEKNIFLFLLDNANSTPLDHIICLRVYIFLLIIGHGSIPCFLLA